MRPEFHDFVEPVVTRKTRWQPTTPHCVHSNLELNETKYVRLQIQILPAMSPRVGLSMRFLVW